MTLLTLLLQSLIPIGKILSEEKIVLHIGQLEIKTPKLAICFV